MVDARHRRQHSHERQFRGTPALVETRATSRSRMRRTNLDAARFPRHGDLTVDTKTPATATVAPAPASPFGQFGNPVLLDAGPGRPLRLRSAAPEALGGRDADPTYRRVERRGHRSPARSAPCHSARRTLRPGRTMSASRCRRAHSHAAQHGGRRRTCSRLTPTSADGKATGPAVTRPSVLPTIARCREEGSREAEGKGEEERQRTQWDKKKSHPSFEGQHGPCRCRN